MTRYSDIPSSLLCRLPLAPAVLYRRTPMLIEKIFHLRQPLSKAGDLLRNVDSWSGTAGDIEVNCSRTSEEGACRIEFRTSGGQLVSADIEEVPGEEPGRIAFRSVGGHVDLAGMIELYPIRPNLTEAVLTVEYEILSPLQKAIEALSESLDLFLNRQLASLEDCFAQARISSAANGNFA